MCVCLFHGRWWQFLKYSESYERRLSHSQDSFSRCEFPSVKSTFHVCTESHDPSERNCIPLQLCKDPCRGKGHAAETTSLKLPLESETERERLRMSKRDWSTRGVQQLCVFLPSLYLTIVYVPILKSRHITLPTKVHLVKAMVFPVEMYRCVSWTIKKAECWRIDAFELWCWRRLLRVPWTARRSNQSILKEISPEYALKGLMLKLKLQYFGHLMWRTYSLEKTLMLGKIEGGRRRGWQMMRWLNGITDMIDMSLSRLLVLVMDRKPGVL